MEIVRGGSARWNLHLSNLSAYFSSCHKLHTQCDVFDGCILSFPQIIYSAIHPSPSLYELLVIRKIIWRLQFCFDKDKKGVNKSWTKRIRESPSKFWAHWDKNQIIQGLLGWKLACQQFFVALQVTVHHHENEWIANNKANMFKIVIKQWYLGIPWCIFALVDWDLDVWGWDLGNTLFCLSAH